MKFVLESGRNTLDVFDSSGAKIGMLGNDCFAGSRKYHRAVVKALNPIHITSYVPGGEGRRNKKK